MFKNVFGSGFLVRTAHVVLTWSITLILFLHDTELARQQASGHLCEPVAFVTLVLVSVLLYMVVSLMDPGFILSDDNDLQFTLGITDEEKDMIIPSSTKSLRQRRCGHCLLQQPMRSKHCHTCQHCVRRYDHHCPWIENCVGEKNHRWFLLYLAVQLMVLLWTLGIAGSGLRSPAPPELSPSSLQPPSSPWQRSWLASNGLLLCVSVLVALLALTVAALLCSHLYLVSLNATTWEFMSRQRISYLKHCGHDANPFDRGAARNLWGFCCLWGEVAWERVYFGEEGDHHPV